MCDIQPSPSCSAVVCLRLIHRTTSTVMIPIDQSSTTGANIIVHKVRVSKLPATRIFTTVFQVECTTRKIDNPISQRMEIARPIFCQSLIERWSRLSEQIFRIDKWSLCQG